MSESEFQGVPEDVPTKARAFILIILLEENESRRRITRIEGLTRVGRFVYRYEFEYTKLISELSLPKHLAFRKGRAIPNVREKQTIEDRTYSIVSYQFHNPTAQQKKRVQRSRLRSPSARLRPGILLFPHLKTRDGKKLFEVQSKRPPLSSKDFAEQLISMGAEATRWTRMKPITPETAEIVVESIKQTIHKEIESLETRIRALRDAVKANEISATKMRERLSELKRQYEDLKATLLIVKQVWSVEADSQLQKLYNLLLSTRNRIRELSE